MANLLSLRSATHVAQVPQPAWPTSNLRRTLSTASDSPCLQWTPYTPAWDTQQVLLHHNRITLYMVCDLGTIISSSCIYSIKCIFMCADMLHSCHSHFILVFLRSTRNISQYGVTCAPILMLSVRIPRILYFFGFVDYSLKYSCFVSNYPR